MVESTPSAWSLGREWCPIEEYCISPFNTTGSLQVGYMQTFSFIYSILRSLAVVHTYLFRKSSYLASFTQNTDYLTEFPEHCDNMTRT